VSVSNNPNSDDRFDVVLVGAGIMSTTLAMLLRELEPDFRILIVERLGSPALESSSALNNAGTGHAANCELNYTPLLSNGTIDITKALRINTSFEKSFDFWASLTEKGQLSPKDFLNVVPHISFVCEEKDINFLHKRYQKLSSNAFFEDMEWSQDHEELKEWMPLVLDGRKSSNKIAATRIKRGTDIDFGALSKSYITSLKNKDNFELKLSTEVINIERGSKNSWDIYLKDLDKNFSIKSKFLFLGAGGGTLSLLQKSGIPESKLYGGFPVSGQWLVCNEKILASNHNAKVYGNAKIGSPPMSVPHLDTRWIDGEKSLLFGPFAGFNTKFLKYGSKWDLFKSIQVANFLPMIQVGVKNVDLIRYLFSQLDLTQEKRLQALREFYPNAKIKDWELSIAGQRVQIIKRTAKGGILKMGTEVVSSADGSIAALLGASPGASTAVKIMLEVIQRCWADKFFSDLWQTRLKKLIPSFGRDFTSDKNFLMKNRQRNDDLLNLI